MPADPRTPVTPTGSGRLAVPIASARRRQSPPLSTPRASCAPSGHDVDLGQAIDRVESDRRRAPLARPEPGNGSALLPTRQRLVGPPARHAAGQDVEVDRRRPHGVLVGVRPVQPLDRGDRSEQRVAVEQRAGDDRGVEAQLPEAQHQLDVVVAGTDHLGIGAAVPHVTRRLGVEDHIRHPELDGDRPHLGLVEVRDRLEIDHGVGGLAEEPEVRALVAVGGADHDRAMRRGPAGGRPRRRRRACAARSAAGPTTSRRTTGPMPSPGRGSRRGGSRRTGRPRSRRRTPRPRGGPARSPGPGRSRPARRWARAGPRPGAAGSPRRPRPGGAARGRPRSRCRRSPGPPRRRAAASRTSRSAGPPWPRPPRRHRTRVPNATCRGARDGSGRRCPSRADVRPVGSPRSWSRVAVAHRLDRFRLPCVPFGVVRDEGAGVGRLGSPASSSSPAALAAFAAALAWRLAK